MSELETRRDGLHGAMAAILDEANGTTEGLAGAVRQAFAEAREAFDTIATPLEMHEFAEQVIGPLTLQRDGRLVPGSIWPPPAIPPGAPKKASRVVPFWPPPPWQQAPGRTRKPWSSIGFGMPPGSAFWRPDSRGVASADPTAATQPAAQPPG